MTQSADARAPGRRLPWPVRSVETPPSAQVTDAQILALVTAADGLRRRQQEHGAAAGAQERLLRLDWAVRAGRAVLGGRAAQSRLPAPTAGRGDR